MNGIVGRIEAITGIRLRSGIRPDAGPGLPTRHRSRWVLVAAMAMLCLMVAPTVGLGLTLRSEIATQARSIRDLESQIDALEVVAHSQPDWPAIAELVLRSVVTISTADSLGSGWVVHSDQSGSDLVTNLHVVAEAWDSGVVVDVAIGDRTVKGTITRVEAHDDLAVVRVAIWLPALERAAIRPELAESVMAVGSPLGLDRSVSIGVVSGFRSVEGSDYIQFSAPISPGNSGGPVVDARGRVVAVATAKFVSPGSEALSLAIPIQTVCRFATCEIARA